MNDRKELEVLSNREFVALVRAKLDAGGHRDVRLERNWIDEETKGYPWLLHVPVGAELTVAVKPTDSFFNKPASRLDWEIKEFAEALVNLRRAEKLLVKYAGDVRKAAVAEIASARSEGLDLLLDHVGFKPTSAHHLSGGDWKEAAMHVLATVTVCNTSFFLRPELSEVWVEEPSEVADELRQIREEQRERQEMLAAMEVRGTDVEVDAITLDLLEAHGFDAPEILRRVWLKQCVNLKVEHNGGERHFSLISSEGRVTASIDTGRAFWNGDHLWFTGEGLDDSQMPSVGDRLGDLAGHPVFASRFVTKIENPHQKPGHELFFFDLTDKVLFDADTGRIWREERLAA